MNVIKSYIVTNAAASSGGGGAGTVTSFSSGNFSPLFTTSVATATTTPALSFTAVDQNANLVYAGPSTGAAAAPTFRALVVEDFPLVSDSNWIFDNPSHANAFLAGANDPFNTVVMVATDLAMLYAGTYGFNITNAGITLDLPSSATGDIFTRDASTFLTRIPDVETGNALISGGVGAVPSYGKIGLTTHVSGILPIANGGTGSATQNFWALGGSSTLTSNVTINGSASNFGLTFGQASSKIGSFSVLLNDDYHLFVGDAAAFLGQYSINTPSSAMETTTSLSGVYDIGIRMGGDSGSGGFMHIEATGVSATKTLLIQGFNTNRFLLGSDTVGDMWYQNASLNLTRIVAGAQNTVLTMGASSVPAWGQVSLTAGVTGILPPDNGGTGVANNAASTLAISGNFATTFTVTATTGLTLPTTGTLATLAGAESLTNKKLGSLTTNGFVKTSGGDGTLSVDTTQYQKLNLSSFFYVNNVTSSLTGTLTETVLDATCLIPAGTIQANDVIRLTSRTTRAGASGTVNLRFRVGTSPVVAGSTQLSLLTHSTTQVYGKLNRDMVFKNSVAAQDIYATTVNGSDDTLLDTNALSTLTVDFSIDQYIFPTAALANTGDTLNLRSWSIQIIRKS